MKGFKKFALIAIMIAMVAALAGCKVDLSGKPTEQVAVFTVGDETVYLNEFWIYGKTIQQEYERNYGEGIWGVELQNEAGDAQNVEEITKEDVVQEILQVKVLVAKSDMFGVALSAEEEAEYQQQAQAFMDGLTDADKAETGVTLDVALQVYRENAIAEKVYERIMENDSVEVSDEQCRQTKIYDLYFPTYVEQGENEFVPYTEEEKAEQQQKAEEAYSRIMNSEDSLNIETAAYEYGCMKSGYHTMSSQEYLETYGQELTDQIYAMQEGSYLGVVESQYGYHIIQMVSLTDVEATQQKKTELEITMKQQYFNSIFDGYLREVDSTWKFSKNVDRNAWELIQFAPSLHTEE